MNPHSYQFPVDQAVEIYHDSFGWPHEGCGLVAVVAPTFTHGISHVGIAEVNGRKWKFLHGPACVQTTKIWKWLVRYDECFPYYNCHSQEKGRHWSIPAANLDDFIDLVTGTEESQ